MKKRGLSILLGSIGLVFVLAAPSVAQVVTLKWTDHNTQMGWGPVHAHQPWFKKVEDATKGRVKIEP
jgi:TRAP-type transport system periplasmic protein